MQSPVTISTQKPDNAAFDYAALREKGIGHIESVASAIWTDYNIHDPGITTLELLCYAITDLSYRANYSIPDLLATEENTAQNSQKQFFSAKQIFPNKAVTITDYRKLVIDIEGIQNAWIIKTTKQIFADITNKKLTHLQPNSRKWETVTINGYYSVLLEYDTEITDGSKKDEIKEEAKALLMANRNLCEDFITIDEVATQEFRLCCEIELAAGANPFDTLAQIFFNIQLYLSPVIWFYPLREMLDNGVSSDSIFEGPLLQHGFMKDEELAASELKTELHLSDIMEEILQADGVVNILDIIFNDTAQVTALQNKWVIPVTAGRKPVLNIDDSNVLLYKDGVPFRPDLSEGSQVRTKYDALLSNYITGNDLVTTEDISYPTGSFQHVDAYYSIQNDYPKNYGIGHWGLPANAADDRQVQAKQLQAYLLFFDQQLANYLSQLFHLRNLFSLDDEPQTYFTQPVSTIQNVADLFTNTSAAGIIQSAAEITGSDAYYKRRNLFLDHLLSRFAESFFDYINILQFAFPNANPKDAVDSKIQFLKNYPAYSSQRFSAYDYTNAASLWDTDNTSGLEKRMESLLGITNNERRNLVNVYSAIQQQVNENNVTVFWFEIIDNRSNKILLKPNGTFDSKDAAAGKLETALGYVGNPLNFSVAEDTDASTFSYQVKDKDGNIIGTSNDTFATNQSAVAAMMAFTTLMSGDQAEEGMFLIEHLLLLDKNDIPSPPPDNITDADLLPICVDDNCDECDDSDPYSFRVSIVLPAYAKRFLNMDFRRYCERVIRTEMPAHIFPKICWVSNEDLRIFETAYTDWLQVKAGTLEDADKTIVGRFINALTTMKSVYPRARLEDCKNTEERTLFLLNQNILGSLKT